MNSSSEDIFAEIQKRAYSEGGQAKLACADAFAVAKQCGIAVGQVGDICNERKIKIAKCQIGCF